MQLIKALFTQMRTVRSAKGNFSGLLLIWFLLDSCLPIKDLTKRQKSYFDKVVPHKSKSVRVNAGWHYG